MDNQNTGKMIGALLIGAAIGGVIGVLFAPDKGSETRKKIAGQTDGLSKSLKEKFNALMEEAKAEFDHAKKEASEYASNGSGK
jgi:gas vesicle protein